MENITDTDTDTDTDIDEDDYDYLHEELDDLYNDIIYNDDDKIDMDFFGKKNCGFMGQIEIQRSLNITFDDIMYNCSCGGDGDDDFLMLELMGNTDKKVVVEFDIILILGEEEKYRYIVNCDFDGVKIPYHTGYLYFLDMEHYKTHGIIYNVFKKVKDNEVRKESKKKYNDIINSFLMKNTDINSNCIIDIISFI